MAKTVYDIITKTGSNGLDNPVHIKINGDPGKFVTFVLNSSSDDFENSATDHFVMTGDKNIGIPSSLEITKGPDGDDNWSLEWIHVTNNAYELNVPGRLTLFCNPSSGNGYPVTDLLKTCPHTLIPFKFTSGKE